MESQDEQCVPWEPVPAAANCYMALNVALFEQAGRVGPVGVPVSAVVVSSLDDKALGSTSVLAWRITFQFVAGYEALPIGRWHGAMPYELADDGLRRLHVGAWEVLNSRWLAAHVTPQHTSRRPADWRLRHFVITSSFDLYAIAAAEWEVQALGPWARVRQRLEARWEQDHLSAP